MVDRRVKAQSSIEFLLYSAVFAGVLLISVGLITHVEHQDVMSLGYQSMLARAQVVAQSVQRAFTAPPHSKVFISMPPTISGCPYNVSIVRLMDGSYALHIVVEDVQTKNTYDYLFPIAAPGSSSEDFTKLKLEPGNNYVAKVDGFDHISFVQTTHHHLSPPVMHVHSGTIPYSSPSVEKETSGKSSSSPSHHEEKSSSGGRMKVSPSTGAVMPAGEKSGGSTTKEKTKEGESG